MGVVVWLIVLIISLLVTVLAANYFVKYSAKLGTYFGVRQFIIGATIVAIGTSLPELISSLYAALNGATEFVAGNVIGSNIANIGLILGTGALVVRSVHFHHKVLHHDIPYALTSVLLFIILASDKAISFTDGIILLIAAGFVVYGMHKGGHTAHKRHHHNGESIVKLVIFVIISCVGLLFAAKYAVDATIQLTQLLGFADTSILALTLVALGTSLPELTVTWSAFRQKKADMALGDILGSNLFNILIVLGVPSLFAPLYVSSSVLFFALPVLLVLMILTFTFVVLQRKITHVEGVILFLIYLAYIVLIVL